MNSPILYVDPTGHFTITTDSHGNTTITFDKSDNGKNVGVSYDPSDHITVNVPEGVKIGSFGTSGSNVTINNEGTIGKIGSPNGSKETNVINEKCLF
jgi:hypothetical protein